MKQSAWMALLSGLVIAAAGCSSAETTEEATRACEAIRKGQQQCMTDEAFAGCVSCREECGRECVQLTSCPIRFECD